MARSHFRDSVIAPRSDGALVPVAHAVVDVFLPGTTTPFPGTLYNAASGGVALANPLTADSSGLVEFWIDTDERLDLRVTKSGFATQTLSVDVTAQQTDTGNDWVGGTVTAVTKLGIRTSGGGAFDRVIQSTEALTAERTFTLTLGNANRTLTLGVDTQVAGAGILALTTVGPTALTLPTTGTLATQAYVQTAIGTYTGSISLTGDLTFNGDTAPIGQRIRGDFSSPTVLSRVLFQTTIPNSTTALGVIPSGSGVVAQMYFYGTTDPTAATWTRVGMTSTGAIVESGSTGVTALDMVLRAGAGASTLTFSAGTALLTSNCTLAIGTGNLTFSGVGPRITGDMSTSPASSRLWLQNSVTNGNGACGLLPNGTSVSSTWTLCNTSDPTATGQFRMTVTGATATLQTNVLGAGTEPTTLNIGSASGTVISIATATGLTTLNYQTTVSALTATPAGGSSAARLGLGTTAGFGIYYGSGVPTVSAAQGSLYLRSDGSSTSTRVYVNTNGTTGWTNVTTAT